jgi:hypothetical protein
MVVIRRLASRTLTLLVACSPELCSSCSKMPRHHMGSHGIFWGWPPPQPNALNEVGITGSSRVQPVQALAGPRPLTWQPALGSERYLTPSTHVTVTLAKCRQVTSV